MLAGWRHFKLVYVGRACADKNSLTPRAPAIMSAPVRQAGARSTATAPYASRGCGRRGRHRLAGAPGRHCHTGATDRRGHASEYGGRREVARAIFSPAIDRPTARALPLTPAIPRARPLVFARRERRCARSPPHSHYVYRGRRQWQLSGIPSLLRPRGAFGAQPAVR